MSEMLQCDGIESHLENSKGDIPFKTCLPISSSVFQLKQTQVLIVIKI